MTTTAYPESRYYGVETYVAWSGYTLTKEYTPVGYRDRDDNRPHVVRAGDTWWSLSQFYFRNISVRACGLYWVLINYQPTPVIDPTLALPDGLRLVIPSELFVRTEVLGLVAEEYT